MKIGLEQGKREGLEEGLEQGRKEIVLKLSKKGYSVEEISFMTDISENQIKTILNS